MHNKTTLALITFLIAAALAGAVSAQVPDFDFLASTQSIDVCMCGSNEILLKIANPTELPEGYLISLSGDGKNLAELPFSYVTLKAGAEIEVPVGINALCGEKGNRELRVKVTSDSGLVKQINVEINTKNCVNIALSNPEYKKDACQCQATVFEFNLSNPGVFRETYYISVDKFKNYTLMSANTVTIQPGSEGKIYVQVSPPCDVVGLQNLSLIVKAKNSGFVASKPFFLDINNCHDYSFNAGGFRPVYDAEGNFIGMVPSDEPQENYTACASEVSRIPIILQNTGVEQNNFSISLASNAPQWASLDLNESLTLGVDASAQFDLVLDAPEGESFEGNITLRALGSIAGVEKEISIPLTLKDCYGFEISFLEEIEQSCCFAKSLPISLTNTGAFEENFRLSLDAPDWVSLSTSQMLVAPNSTQEFSVSFTPPCDLNGQADITVNARLEKESLNMTQSASTSFEAVEINTCQQADMEDLQFLANNRANTYYGEYRIPLKIYNRGIRSTNYILTLQAPEWMTLEPDIVAIDAGSEAVVMLRTAAPISAEKGIYNIEVILQPEDSNAVYRMPFSIRLKEYSAWDQVAHSFDQYALLYTIGILVVIILVLYLVVKPKKAKKKLEKPPVFDIEDELFETEKEIEPKAKLEVDQEPKVEVYRQKKSSPWRVWVSILVIVLVLAGITGYLLSMPPGEQDEEQLGENESIFEEEQQPIENETQQVEEELPIESFTYMLFNEGETRVINLNDHFYDPDSDVLTFGFTETENFDVELDEGVVSITPQDGFVGEEEIVFFAQDDKGGRISSPPVTLRALEGSPIEREPEEALPEEVADFENATELSETEDKAAEDDSEQPTFRTYMFYILLGIVLLIVIVLILELSSRGKKKDKDEPNEIDLEEELEKK